MNAIDFLLALVILLGSFSIAGMNSPGHSANILSKEFRRLGIGVEEEGPWIDDYTAV